MSNGAKPFRCPHCGHEFSMFAEHEPDRGERAAQAVTARLATWWFPSLILVGIGVWLFINVVFRPFDGYPMSMLAGLAAALSSMSALQAPLILLAQRRALERDRALEREILRTVAHNERDVHAVHDRLDQILAALAR